MDNKTEKEVKRFWDKVNKDHSDYSYNGLPCWEWNAGCDAEGYGIARIWGLHLGAHRISYELKYGSIPFGLQVLHHCDNRRCVRPDHLFLGTHEINMKDRDQKGRQAMGEKNGMAKLTKEQVMEIRRRYGRFGKGGEKLKALAKEFNISYQQISKIINFQRWKNEE